MTENKKPLVKDEAKPTETKNTIDKVSEKKLTDKKSDTTKSPNKTPNKTTTVKAPPSKMSKLAILAIIIAIAAPAGHYLWQQQQEQLFSKQLTNTISQKSTAELNHFQTQFQQALNEQQRNFTQQLQKIKEQVSSTNQERIAQLTQSISQLEQRIKLRQPSDWLLHESEYLIRVAARTLWLEHDTTAAMGLLKDADARLTELNDPSFLPVRELIHQDIKSLEQQPKLQTDEVVLALMAMSKQVATLPLSIVDINSNAAQAGDNEVSDNISDWQTNLAKTWQKFLDDFIRVRARSGSIEPLLAPNQQANLLQNLSLKIQLAIWAATEGKGDVYQRSLSDIEQWLNQFFDMDHEYNQQFMQAIASLKTQRINYDYSNELASLSAIKAALNNQVNRLPSQSPVPNAIAIDQAEQDETNAEDEL